MCMNCNLHIAYDLLYYSNVSCTYPYYNVCDNNTSCAGPSWHKAGQVHWVCERGGSIDGPQWVMLIAFYIEGWHHAVAPFILIAFM